MTQYECVSCLVIAIVVAFVVVIHLQCLVSVYSSLVKIKYSVCAVCVYSMYVCAVGVYTMYVCAVCVKKNIEDKNNAI